MSTRAEFFQSMYPGLSDGEVIDELIKASIYGFEHGPEVVTISAAEGIHYVPYDAAMQKKSPVLGGHLQSLQYSFYGFPNPLSAGAGSHCGWQTHPRGYSLSLPEGQ